MNALQLYQRNIIPLHVTLDIWARIAMATQAMHNRHILHQDLKPDNILITDVGDLWQMSEILYDAMNFCIIIINCLFIRFFVIQMEILRRCIYG